MISRGLELIAHKRYLNSFRKLTKITNTNKLILLLYVKKLCWRISMMFEQRIVTIINYLFSYYVRPFSVLSSYRWLVNLYYVHVHKYVYIALLHY